MTTTRRLAAILAADVAGYSRLMAADEGGTLARFKLLRSDHLEPAIRARGGRIVGEAGDSLLIEFGAASEAVAFAVEVQEKLASLNADLPEDRRMRFRIGINLGEVIADGATIHGDGVNVAARLEKLAEPGGIVVADTVQRQAKGKVPWPFEDLGEKTLHNIAEPVRAYRLVPNETRRSGQSTRSASDEARRRRSIAVLPFANMSGDPEQEYFSDGITEDLITSLARHHTLFVIARNSSFVFKGRTASIPEVGRQLGVRYVVEGSVRKAGKRIRVTAQLIDAETGAHVWAEKYDRDLEDVFAVQDEIVETLVWRVAGNVTKAELNRAKSTRTGNLDAYDLLLQGISKFERATYENTEDAIGIWQEAYELDPTWGRPLSHIAMAYMALGFQTLDAQHFDNAIDHAQRALALADAEDWTEALIGYVAAKRGDFKTADLYIGRAIARNPMDRMTMQWHAYSLYWRGNAREAIEIGTSLRRLDPFEHVWLNDLLGYAYYCIGDYEASLDSFRRCMPFAWWGDYGFLAACLGQLGRAEEARAAWQHLLTSKPELSVEEFVAAISVSRQEDKEHWRLGLRKAGITE
jgi:adenylate cyclase